MKKLVVCFILFVNLVYGQGFNHQWLLGSYLFFPDPKGRILFDATSYTLVNENRKMVFNGTEANISDANGNLLMSSNGSWIANALGDTMLNGGDLAPSYLTDSWPYGIPLNYGDVFLPFPNDSNKYILFHKSKWGQFSISTTALYKSEIDLIQDSVISLNDTLIADTLSWGVGACKHANGRDWWVFVVKDGNPAAYTLLLTPNGIDTIFIQSLNFTSNTYGVVSPIIFSQDGKKMIFCTPINQTPSGTVLLYDFDRCTGLFSNMNVFPISPGAYVWGLAFSPSGEYAYACTSNSVYQINVDSLTFNSVATYDGFISPVGSTCCATTFFGMYLAANGKIYITSGSGVQHLHEMNYPDSAGMACNVQQHTINLGYAQLRAVPNHPNYYLGCDTTSSCTCLTGIDEITHDFHFSVFPNPSNGVFNISYSLPQNKAGKLELYNITGDIVFSFSLPQWSTLQSFSLPHLANGLYALKISSDNYNAVVKIVFSE